MVETIYPKVCLFYSTYADPASTWVSMSATPGGMLASGFTSAFASSDLADSRDCGVGVGLGFRVQGFGLWSYYGFGVAGDMQFRV